MKHAEQVTIICIAFNHEKWIEKALDSVHLQSYECKQLLIVDNGSVDQTAWIIRNWAKSHSMTFPVSVIYKTQSMAYCKLFNEMLNLTNGEFIVDLSGDDFLYPQHLSLSIDRLRQVPNAAFVFSDAHIRKENGAQKSFYKSKEVDDLKDQILGRDFYQTLISRSCISSPTVVLEVKFSNRKVGMMKHFRTRTLIFNFASQISIR